MVRITPPKTNVRPTTWANIKPGEACVASLNNPVFIYLKLEEHRTDSLAFDVDTGAVVVLERSNLQLSQTVFPIKTDIHFNMSNPHGEQE